MPKLPATNKPVIVNIFKPARITSYDVIRAWKRKLRPYGKVGHFGTLDPFASGVLMVGAGGAQRLNEYIHECLPKTYLAVGKLGVASDTGDLTEGTIEIDTGTYLRENIAELELSSIEEVLRKEFIGEYWQAPHKYSAAKFEGKALHKWAREGVEIKKEKKQRFVYDLKVIKYQFPYLSIQFQVSSGTYIRTLFSDCANYLGTLGALVSLVRESVGPCNIKNAIYKGNWENDSFREWRMDEVLDFSILIMAPFEEKLYANGVKLKIERAKEEITKSLDNNYRWVMNEDRKILGLGEIVEDEIHSKVNFPGT